MNVAFLSNENVGTVCTFSTSALNHEMGGQYIVVSALENCPNWLLSNINSDSGLHFPIDDISWLSKLVRRKMT